MSRGSKKVCRTWPLPGAARKIATSAASTTRVLTVDTTVARRPPPDRSRGPRPTEPKPAAGIPAARPADSIAGPSSGPYSRSLRPPPGLLPVIARQREYSAPLRLDRGNGQVDLEVLRLERCQGPVGLEGRDRLVHAANQRVALAEQQSVVLTRARELRHHDRVRDLGR